MVGASLVGRGSDNGGARGRWGRFVGQFRSKTAHLGDGRRSSTILVMAPCRKDDTNPVNVFF